MPKINKAEAFVKAAMLSKSGNTEHLSCVSRVLERSIVADKKSRTYNHEIYLNRIEKKCFG